MSFYNFFLKKIKIMNNTIIQTLTLLLLGVTTNTLVKCSQNQVTQTNFNKGERVEATYLPIGYLKLASQKKPLTKVMFPMSNDEAQQVVSRRSKNRSEVINILTGKTTSNKTITFTFNSKAYNKK